MARSAVSQTLFDVWSRVYDLPVVQRLVYRVDHDVVVGRLTGAPGTVVDLGCGTGLLTARLAERWPQAAVVGCDFSRGMLAEASDRGSAARWVQGDAGGLPLREASVDVLTCTESFHWYPDQEAAMGEIARVLRPGGQALFTVVHPVLRSTSRVAEEVTGAVGQTARFPTRAEMASLVTGAGLRLVDQANVRRLPFGAGMAPVLTIAERPR